MKLFDLLSMIFCFIIAASIESNIEHITLEQFLSMRIKIQNVVLFSGFIFLWHNTLAWFGLYDSQRLSTLKHEIVEIVKAVSIGTIVLIVIAVLFNVRMASRSFFVVFWAGAGMITITSRIMLKLVLEKFRIHGRNLRNIIIVGANSRARRFAKQLETKIELGYRLVGFADNECPQLQKVQQAGHAVVSSLKELPSYLRRNIVDEVMICLPIKSYYSEASDIVAACEEQGVIVSFFPDFFNLKIARIKTSTYDGESIATLITGDMVGHDVLIKRAMDIVLSLGLIIALTPVFLIVALLIKLTSPGTVFFVQKRLGLNKRMFDMYKFRTMAPDAEKKQAELEQLNEVKGAAFKIKNDPRITPMGKFLRKTSIDELPQLFNVLKGYMSLVGPRPLPVRDYEGFDQDWHRRRFSVRPGITCLWQISGRSDISFDRWMELDMEYIDNWSLWLDFKILLGTIPAVLKGSGAV